MVRFDKRAKQWVSGGIIIVLSVVIWMVYFYTPLKAKESTIITQCNLYNERIKQLKHRLIVLERSEKECVSKGNDLTRFSKIMVYGGSVDDINAETQIMFQKFFEKNNMILTSYKVLSSSKWKKYDIGRVEFNLLTSMTGVDRLLKYIENLDKVIRVEKFSINYTGRKVDPLRVSLRMATLFLDIGTIKGS